MGLVSQTTVKHVLQEVRRTEDRGQAVRPMVLRAFQTALLQKDSGLGQVDSLGVAAREHSPMDSPLQVVAEESARVKECR